MSLIGDVLFRGRILESSHPSKPAPWLADFFGGGASLTGEKVTPDTAMQVSTVFACVRFIAENCGSFDVFPFKKLKQRKSVRGRQIDESFDLFPMLTGMANTEQTFAEFIEMITGHALLRGNGYAQIIRNGLSEVVALIPLHPDRMVLERDPKTNELIYVYTPLLGETTRLKKKDVFHFRAFGTDGVYGLSPIAQAANTVGLAMATERHGARFFGKAAVPNGLLSHPGKISDAAKEHLKKSVKEEYSGPQNSHGLMVLEEGMKFEQMGLKNNEAQFLETRAMQRGEICAIYGVPEDLLYTTGNNATALEFQFRKFFNNTLRLWLKRWKKALESQVFTAEERKTHEILFDVKDVLEADPLKNAQYVSQLRQIGLISINDGREMLDMNQISEDWADVYLVPQNMVPADRVDDVIDNQTKSAEKPKDKGTDTLINPDKAPGSNRELIRQAFSVVLGDDLRRIARKEAINVEKIAKRAAKEATFEEFEREIGAWYEEQRDYMRESLDQTVRGVLIAAGIQPSSNQWQAVAAELVEKHVQRSRSRLKSSALTDLLAAAEEIRDGVDDSVEFVEFILEKAGKQHE